VGLSGLDGRLLQGKRKAAIRIIENGRQRILRDDWTGTVERVNADLLRLLLDQGYLPVIAPLACSEAGEAINVDGDRAAAAIAAALNAETLLLLSNVPGLLREFPNEDSLIPRIPRAEIEAYLPFAEGRMKKKVLGAGEALERGVGRVILGDARAADSVSRALAGAGTVVE
jgi:acetylglutamate/LysW-gamma-L-alpha-aminoadipate kinase